MKDNLNLVGKLSDSEKMCEEFCLTRIYPDDAKYAKSSEPLRPYLSEDALWRECAHIQQVLLETGVKFGRGSGKNIREIRRAMNSFSPLNAKLIEKNVTKHDQLAVIEEIGRSVSPETKYLLHPGTTSYDILDTAKSRLLKKAWKEEVRPKVGDVVHKICDLGEDYIDIVQAGRTHLQKTSPVSFGGQLAGYATRLANRMEYADKVFDDMRGTITGIVGTGAGTTMVFGDRAEEYEKKVLEKLDLKPDTTATQIVQKERLADAGHALVTLDGVLCDLANDVRILYSSEIQEVTSRDNEKRLGGSSTDAGKNNPINWENIAGKYCEIKSGMTVLYELIGSDLQRDLRSSVQLRYQPGMMMTEVYESFGRASKALDQFSVNTDKIEENLEYVRRNPTEAMVTILKGENFIHGEYGLPHDFVKEMAKKSKNDGNKLIDVCFEDKEFAEVYKSMLETKQEILNGKLENYLGFSKKRARDNIEYARKII